MSTITSINPATGLPLKTYDTLDSSAILAKINLSQDTFLTWQNTSLATRSKILMQVAKTLIARKPDLASLMSSEMGKRISESLAEIDKCALVCEYYARETKNLLAPELIPTEASKSYVRFDPLGVVLAIMPWNFPFWQVFRAATPAIMAGNTMLLKHASSVPGCALAIEEIFLESGLPNGVFQTLLITGSQTKQVIEHESVRLVSLTGSEEAGSQVAGLAGQNLKKSVLELGGSDPFIIMPDADLFKAVDTAVTSRLIVSGQSCIAAKRFIVHNSIVDKFTKLFKQAFEVLKIGDPQDPSTQLGPLSSEDSLSTLADQIKRSLSAGAKLITGGSRVDRPGYFFAPTILGSVTKEMPVAREETFGPVAAVISASSREEALQIANNSHFGLGSSVWTSNKEDIEYFASGLQAGSVFINSMVKSDPRLPFGGTKFSGYGRELGSYGIKEFVNIKTVWVT